MSKMDSAEEDASAGRSTRTNCRLRWSKEMEELIVELWEENIEDYFGARKRSLIYKDMAESIAQAGFVIQWTDVRSKIENLTRKYKSEKDKVLASNGTPSRWPPFDKIHSFLSAKGRLKREYQKDMKVKEEEDDESEFLDDFGTDQDTQAQLLEIAREQLQIMREEQICNREHRRNQLKALKYIARSQDRLHSLLVQLLTDTNDTE